MNFSYNGFNILMSRFNTIIHLILIFSLTFCFTSCIKEVSEPIEPTVLKKLKLIPENPVNIIYLNFKNLKKTKSWQNFFTEDLNVQTSESKNIFDSLGIDFNNDIDEIIIASQWNDINTYIITLNNTKNLKHKKLKESDFKFYFIDEKILFITNDEKKLEKVIHNDFESSFIKNPLFRRIINSIQYKEQFWFVTKNNSFFIHLLENGNYDAQKLENLFRTIQFINFSLKIDKDLSLNSHWECIDTYRANLLRGVLDGLISVLALTEPNDPFARELAKANIFIENKAVNISLKLSKNEFEKLRQSTIANKLKRITGYEQ